jgi:hypothetical protein
MGPLSGLDRCPAGGVGISQGVPDTSPEPGGRSSIGRADAILSTFDERHPTMSLTEIVVRTGLPKTTVYRAIEKMLELGWLEHDGGRYSIGSRLFEVAALRRPV